MFLGAARGLQYLQSRSPCRRFTDFGDDSLLVFLGPGGMNLGSVTGVKWDTYATLKVGSASE